MELIWATLADQPACLSFCTATDDFPSTHCKPTHQSYPASDILIVTVIIIINTIIAVTILIVILLIECVLVLICKYVQLGYVEARDVAGIKFPPKWHLLHLKR